VSVAALSTKVLSVKVVSAEIIVAEVSVIVLKESESEDEDSVLLELQAATDKEIATAKKPNLKKFFMFLSFG
jgi:hypothetical protein